MAPEFLTEGSQQTQESDMWSRFNTMLWALNAGNYGEREANWRDQREIRATTLSVPSHGTSVVSIRDMARVNPEERASAAQMLVKESHQLLQALEMTFACKKCKKCFRKDAEAFEEADEYCPHCDNHFVIDAVIAKPALRVEGEDARVDNRMLKDDRVKNPGRRTIFDVQDDADKLG
ncbi:hypothetical protein F5X97DRAFT_318796 [Nemania serpens]|nr:hypothetical protein F5X97DRAFT_318796 [Nemania serpens]